MKRAVKAIAATLGAAMTLTLLVATPAYAAEDVLAVNFGQKTGAFRRGASGTLYGLGDRDAPTAALINGAHITNTSQKAPFGTQHPSGDAVKVEGGFFQKHGDEMYIYMQDYYPDWAYNGGQRPGDTRTYNQSTGTYTSAANGIWDYLEVVEFVTRAVATTSAQPQKYVLIPFNEPDAGNWYPNWSTQKNQFLADWQAAYTKIQAVWSQAGLGRVRVGGPGDASWQPQRTADFLDFTKANNSIPDIVIWHELGLNGLAEFRGHLAEYRGQESSRGITPRQINITEYGLLRDMGVPGQLVQWFSLFESTKVDAQTAYWNYAGNFSDNSARPNGANGGWWMFKWYGDLEGSTTASVTPPQPNVTDTLQGIGAVNETDKRATVLFGGGSQDVRLNLSGLSSSVFGTSVDVEVREAPLTGAEGLAETPRVIQSIEGATVTNGNLSLLVDTYDRYAGYQVIVTPNQTRDVAAARTAQQWTTSVEAESTALTGATVFTQSPTGNGGFIFLASGGKDVGAFNQVSSKADWSVTVPATGTYRFQVIGATPGTPGRHALFVDGGFSKTVQYAADLALNDTSKWKYRGSAEVLVDLTAGTHTLSLRASQNGTAVLPNSDITLDKFTLTADAGYVDYPASTFRLYGGAALGYASGSSGFASIAGASQRADLYTTAMETGYQNVTVDYRTTGASSVTLTVNGKVAATLSAGSAGLWRSQTRLHLVEGINEIELRSASGARIESLSTQRVRSADSAEVVYEAESGTRAGAAAVRTPGAGSNASGSVVGFVGNGAGNTLTFPRVAGDNTAGLYNVTVAYANAELAGAHAYNPQVVDRLLTLTEVGTGVAGSAYFRYTYSWDSISERSITVNLATGSGAIQLGSTSGYAPDIDRVTVSPLRLGTPTTVSITSP